MISTIIFKENKVVVVDAVGSNQKDTLLGFLSTMDNNTTVQDLEDFFIQKDLYYIIGNDNEELGIVGSRPGTIKR